MSLAAEGLGVTAEGRSLLREITLRLVPGEVLGVIGPNGAGKSTLVRALAGLVRPAEGSVSLDGRPLRTMTARERASAVAFVAQETAVSADLTALDLVRMGRYAHRRRLSRATREDDAAARGALARVGMTALADRPVPTLSGGERQLVQLARALAQGTRALLLDEPTSALDIRHQLRVFSLLRAEARAGAAVAAVLHALDDAARYCDRLAVVHRGALVALGPPEEVLTPEMLAEVYRVDALVLADAHGPRVRALAPREPRDHPDPAPPHERHR